MADTTVLEIAIDQEDLRAAREPDARARRLADQLILHALPALAEAAGVERHRLAGAFLVELGYVVGLSHAPPAAVAALAVAAERLRDALAHRREPGQHLPAPTVPGPASLQ